MPLQPDHEGDAFFDRSLYESSGKKIPKKRSASQMKTRTADHIVPRVVAEGLVEEDTTSSGTFRERLTRVTNELYGEGSPEGEMILRQGEQIPKREEEPLHKPAHVKKKKFR